MTTDLRIIEAARRLDRENLDGAKEHVHVCDRNDDKVLRQQLHGAARELSEAIAAAGLTLPPGK